MERRIELDALRGLMLVWIIMAHLPPPAHRRQRLRQPAVRFRFRGRRLHLPVSAVHRPYLLPHGPTRWLPADDLEIVVADGATLRLPRAFAGVRVPGCGAHCVP